MMNYSMMSGTDGSGFMLLGWLSYVLVIILLVLGVMALWKYINSK